MSLPCPLPLCLLPFYVFSLSFLSLPLSLSLSHTYKHAHVHTFTYTRLLHCVCKELAEWYFQDGCAVLAACCHLAVDNTEVRWSEQTAHPVVWISFKFYSVLGLFLLPSWRWPHLSVVMNWSWLSMLGWCWGSWRLKPRITCWSSWPGSTWPQRLGETFSHTRSTFVIKLVDDLYSSSLAWREWIFHRQFIHSFIHSLSQQVYWNYD